MSPKCHSPEPEQQLAPRLAHSSRHPSTRGTSLSSGRLFCAKSLPAPAPPPDPEAAAGLVLYTPRPKERSSSSERAGHPFKRHSLRCPQLPSFSFLYFSTHTLLGQSKVLTIIKIQKSPYL